MPRKPKPPRDDAAQSKRFIETARELGDLARRRARELFSSERMVHDLLTLYDEIAPALTL